MQFPTDVDTHGKIEKAGPTSAVQHVPDRHHVAGETGARPSTIQSEPKKIYRNYTVQHAYYSVKLSIKVSKDQSFFFIIIPKFFTHQFHENKN